MLIFDIKLLLIIFYQGPVNLNASAELFERWLIDWNVHIYNLTTSHLSLAVGLELDF